MAPAAGPSWPWGRRDEAPLKRPVARAEARISPAKRPRPEPPPLALKTADDSLAFDAARLSRLPAPAPAPAAAETTSVVESAKQISSIPKHVIRKPAAVRLESTPAIACPDSKTKTQQGRITEYFKSQMKPANGSKKVISNWMSKGSYARRKTNTKSASEANENLEKYITYLSQTLNPKVLLNPSKVEKRAADSIGDNIKIIDTKIEKFCGALSNYDRKEPLLSSQAATSITKLTSRNAIKNIHKNTLDKLTNDKKSSSKGNLKKVRPEKKRNSINVSKNMQSFRQITDLNLKSANCVSSSVASIVNEVTVKNHTKITTVNNVVTSTTQCSKISLSQENESQSILQSINMTSERMTTVEKLKDDFEDSCHMISSSTLAAQSMDELNANISVTTSAGLPFLTLPQATVMLTTIRLPQNSVSQTLTAAQNQTYNGTQHNIPITSPTKISGQFVLPVVQNLNGTMVHIPSFLTKMGENIVIPNGGAQLTSQGSHMAAQPQMLLNGTLLKLNPNLHPHLSNLVSKTNPPNLSYSMSTKNHNSSVPVVVSKANFPVALNHPLFVPSSGFIINPIPSLITTQTSPTVHQSEQNMGSNIMFTNSPNIMHSMQSNVGSTMANIAPAPCAVPSKPTSYVPILPRKASNTQKNKQSPGPPIKSAIMAETKTSRRRRKVLSSNSSSIVDNSSVNNIHIEITPESLIEAVINSKFYVNDCTTDSVKSSKNTNNNSAKDILENNDCFLDIDSNKNEHVNNDINEKFDKLQRSIRRDNIMDNLSDDSSGIVSTSSSCERSTNRDIVDTWASDSSCERTINSENGDTLSDNSNTSGIVSAISSFKQSMSPSERTSNVHHLSDDTSESILVLSPCGQTNNDDNVEILSDSTSGIVSGMSLDDQNTTYDNVDSLPGVLSYQGACDNAKINTLRPDSASELLTCKNAGKDFIVNSLSDNNSRKHKRTGKSLCGHTSYDKEDSIYTDNSSCTPSTPSTRLNKEGEDLSNGCLSVSVDSCETPSTSQKSPILSQPKTIRFPVKLPHHDSKSLNRLNSRESSDNIKACQWDHCDFEYEFSSELLEHLQEVHIVSQVSRESYVCLWAGCKVKGRASCSRLWLERHTLSHGGNKPFRCIVDQCGKRFNTQLLLQRHVNGHFTEQSPNVNSAKKSSESSASKLLKRNGKKLRFRRQPWSARMFDFFDTGIMEGLQHRLLSWSRSAVNASGPGAEHCVQFTCRVIARRKTHHEANEALVAYTPPNILDNEWILDKDVLPTKLVHIKDLSPAAKQKIHEQFVSTDLRMPQISREIADDAEKHSKVSTTKSGRRLNGVKTNILVCNKSTNGIKRQNGHLKCKLPHDDQNNDLIISIKSENETNTANVVKISNLVDSQNASSRLNTNSDLASNRVRVTGAAKRKQGRTFGGYCFYPSGR